MRDNLEWKELRSDKLTGEDAKVVKAFEDARAALEAYVEKKQGPSIFSYKRGGIAFAKKNGGGGTVNSI